MDEQDWSTDLIEAAQRGDQDAFATLVRRYQDIAVAFATAAVGDYHLAQDAAQEAFAEAHRRLPALRVPRAFGAWFRTIIVKHCDRITRRRHHPATSLDLALGVASTDPSPPEVFESAETRAALQRAIAALSEAQRQVVLLHYMADRSQGEIAAFLGVTPNAVKTRLYTARLRLRSHLGDVERSLQAARPSRSPTFAEGVLRMIRPDALKKKEPLVWSPGIGTDVWEMFCAALSDDVEALERLLERDPALVRAHYHGRTALSLAVRENRVRGARLLLERGADPIQSGTPDTLVQIARDRGWTEMQALLERALARAGRTPPAGEEVAAAIRERDLAKVRQLLDASPALVHAPDGSSNQPIHWAALTRQMDVIDELLRRGADIDARRANGARPIQLAYGDYLFRSWMKNLPATCQEVIAHLRARGAYCDICTAAYIGDIARVRQLLDEDPSLANRTSEYVTYYPCSGTPLRNAAAAGHLEIVLLLLARGADPNLPEKGIAPRGHALYSAVYHRHFHIAKLLLERGAYPNVEVESSADTLSIALINGDKAMVDLLCSYGAARPVHLLAHYGDVQTAAAVFAAKPTLADDPDALGSAAGHEPFVRLMLRYCPELPKRAAVAGKTREVTELLFRHGMDPSHPDWLHITPLHRFAERGDVENAAIFIEHGADLDARDEELRSTPLGYAAKYGRRRMAVFLLRRGATPALPDDPPWATPLAWATRRGYDGIVQMLDAFLADRTLPPEPSLDEYDRLAADLAAAYNTGDTAAAHRVAEYFEVDPRTWNTGRSTLGEIRHRVRGRVDRLAGPDGEGSQLHLEESRNLVAWWDGFRDWAALSSGRAP